MRKYLFCLRQRYASSLLIWNFLGRLPAGMGSLAIVLFLRAHDVAYGRLGAITALYAACSAVGAPVLARLIDKRGQKVPLPVAALISGLGFALLAGFGVRHTPIVLLGVGLAGFFMPPLEPALRSVWPSVLPDESTVEVAYALDSALQNILFVSGPVLVVLLYGAVDPATAVLVIGGIAVVGTLAFVALPPVRSWRGAERVPDWAGALRSRTLVVLLVTMVFLGSLVGVLNVATVAYAEMLGRDGLAGLQLAAFSVGSLVGGLAYGARQWTGDPLRRLLVISLIMAVATWPLVLVPGPNLQLVLMGIAGLGLAPVLTCCFVLVGRVVPTGTVTEAFAWITAVFLGGSACGSALVGAVLPHTGLTTAFALGAAGSTAAFLTTLFLALRRPADNMPARAMAVEGADSP
ncbi:MFS transporter [Actinoplanes teichomyceticus]|uniref:Putative MFS family arabinose efflux permease n=1 Tax=Actinoplanes teichomyceticus TaxID=1867 RepID=A0A561VIL9_ACTTI|nr:MFS transporter [Actinoplanes teichomyceticus]TWG11459.1 putative MFS family arabinose efflux permease [Actinoplanes teichomyceticus]GIF15727.1 MFS transporter [Actinoplanes teichomyceticus]